MSPMMMALLALLAYKAFKGRSHPAPGGQPTGAAPSLPPGTQSAGSSGGGFGDLLGGLFGRNTGGSSGSLDNVLRGGLGGLLGGATAGSVLSGGLGNLVKDLQERGYGDAANSWVGPGQNQAIAPDDLEHALGADTIDTLTRQSGLSRDELLSGLSDHLPDLVDQLTPHGRLPTEHEASTMV
jgi:uncharacterized protein YidB (DUF937 family)